MKLKKLIIVGLFLMVTVHCSFAQQATSRSNTGDNPLDRLLVLYAKEIVYPHAKQVLAKRIADKLKNGRPTLEYFILYTWYEQGNELHGSQLKQQYDEIVRVFDAAFF